MNIVDMIIIMIVVYFMYSGFVKGFIMTIYGIANIAISWLLTVKFYPIVSQYIMKNEVLLAAAMRMAGSLKYMIFNVASIKPFVNLISIILTFLFFIISLKIFAVTLNNLLNYTPIKIFNKLGGGLLGMIEGLALVFFTYSLFKAINYLVPLSYWTYIDSSQLAKLFLNNSNIFRMFLL